MQRSPFLKKLTFCLVLALILGLAYVFNCKPMHTTQAIPDFGPHVKVFDPSMSAVRIQQEIDAIFKQQESNQFGPQRYALLFKPGHYQNKLQIGFYTQALGLGLQPDDVSIDDVQVNAQWYGGDATQNFWRGIENLAVHPPTGTMQWAVSQASPLRRLHVHGNMVLDDDEGWSSGGFIADTWIDGTIDSGTQQQWLTRNSHWQQWQGRNWNMVFVGDDHPPSTEHWFNTGYTVVKETPRIREKPFLMLNKAGEYGVFLPALTYQTQGVSWQKGISWQTSAKQKQPAKGDWIPLTQFYIAKAKVDNATSINRALEQGKHLLLTPGIYDLDNTLQVSQANTIVLGLGLATLRPTTGLPAMQVADVDGVKLAGLLFEASPRNSPVLLRVGTAGQHRSHSNNPISLHDLFFRVGGAGVGKADRCLEINSDDVIGDHFWLWRADHGTGVGWDTNTTQHGLVVNGDRVTIYGLATEHFHAYQTVWNGNAGSVYFYQSEAPYDVPNQSSWMNDKVNGFASYKVGEQVTSHQAYGVGVYCYFIGDPRVKLHSGIEAPTQRDIRFHHLTSVSLGGEGEITHVINELGQAANAKQAVVHLDEAP